MMDWKVTGHNRNKKYFENIIEKSVLSHAYVFSGPEGIGKALFAKDIFRLINHREPDGDPDFKLISPGSLKDDTSETKIGNKIYTEEIRELKSYLSLKPYFGPYKFVLIDRADLLVPYAGSSFLKVLEEPAPFSVIILVTSKPKLVLPTVLSRCEKITFLPLSGVEKTVDAEKHITEFVQIRKQGVFERMKYAEKVFNDNNYRDLVISLIHNLRRQTVPDHRTLKNLLKLNLVLSQPQFNHRLALENFMINLS